MAKKKKRLSRLNGAVRRFFDGDGFDEGIERVDTQTLSELIQTLGIVPDNWKREALIRLLRRLWSEAKVEVRRSIVAYFTAEGKVYPSAKTKAPSQERSDKITSILETMEVTPDEARALHDAFIEVRTKKITPQKVAAKLEHLRFERKRTRIEKRCEGLFDIDDRFEFNTVLHYDIFGEQFTKIHPLRTPPFAYNDLKEQKETAIVHAIEHAKSVTLSKAQNALENFLRTLDTKHPYFDTTTIVRALKCAPPDTDPTLPPIDDTTLLNTLRLHVPILHGVVHNGEEVLLSVKGRFVPKGFEHPLIHEAHLPFEAAILLETLWKGEPIDLIDHLENALKQERESFCAQLNALTDACLEYAKALDLDRQEVLRWIEMQLQDRLDDTLLIHAKLWRRILFHWERHIQDALLRYQRRQLLARTIRDFKNLFPLARRLHRKLVFHVGPTNSGKTYRAMQALMQADTGYYLAPLRLLALEGYESLSANGIAASLVTGEEQLLDDKATHIASTIEMLDFDADVDVCVIDEVQMLGDRDRGWAWANAIIGAPAKTVIMTGSENALDAVEALADYLGERLEIVRFARKNPLELLHASTPVTHITPKTAIVAFSRKQVLRLKQQLSRHFRVSVVYGNLSPEVRREEARRFREGETDLLVATDAIAMGLNLPIKTILFARADKFDGENQRPLTASEIHQIAGRAGRYGIEEKGYVGALTPDVLRVLHKQFPKPARPVSLPFHVKASLDHILLVGRILEENALANILKFFATHMHFTGPFRAANLESMLEAAAIVDRYTLDLRQKYHLASAPLSLKSPYLAAAFERYVRTLDAGKPVAYLPPNPPGEYAQSTEELLEAEDRVKEISLYLWLAYRFDTAFPDTKLARKWRRTLNVFIENSLKKSEFLPRCRQCATILPIGGRYNLCQRCFRKLNLDKRRRKQ